MMKVGFCAYNSYLCLRAFSIVWRMGRDVL